jgi:hypothetical protein
MDVKNIPYQKNLELSENSKIQEQKRSRLYMDFQLDQYHRTQERKVWNKQN